MMENIQLKEVEKFKCGNGLLIENDGYITTTKDILTEGINGDKEWYVPNPFIVSAVFQKYDVKNANGRIYPENILKREVEKYMEKVNNRQAFGECNHPDSSSIDLSRVSHNIIELHWEGKTLVGKMEIFTSYGFRQQGIISTCGDIIANLILSGYKIGVSSRAVGSVTEKFGALIVGDDLELICWDCVATPSTPSAYIYTDDNDKKMYIENKKSDDKNLLHDKISKINNILS